MSGSVSQISGWESNLAQHLTWHFPQTVSERAEWRLPPAVLSLAED